MSAPLVYADFNNLDDFNRLRLTCAGTLADLQRQGIELKEGLALTFYMDDGDDEGRVDNLLVDGTVHQSKEDSEWVAEANWSELRHASKERGGQACAVAGTTAQPEFRPLGPSRNNRTGSS